jgi:glycyl-tRNA synthetase beta chain
LQPAVTRFFDDVLVMTQDESLRTARLALVTNLRDLILHLADISEIVPEAQS